MTAFLATVSFANAQERRTNNTPAPAPHLTPMQKQEIAERDKKYEAQRNLEKQQAVQSTVLTNDDQKRLEAIQQKEYEAARKAEMEGKKVIPSNPTQTAKFDDTPKRDMSVGVDGMKSESDIKAYNEQIKQTKVPSQSNTKMDALTPEQRLEFERKNELNQKRQNQTNQQLNADGANNSTQRKPLADVTPKVQQDVHPVNNGGSAATHNLTPEQRRIQEATQSGKAGARAAQQPVQVPAKTEVRSSSVSGNSTQQAMSPDQIAAFEKRAQFEKATSNGEAGRKQETPSTPAVAPVKRAQSQSGNSTQQTADQKEISKEQLQFQQATQSGVGGKR